MEDIIEDKLSCHMYMKYSIHRLFFSFLKQNKYKKKLKCLLVSAKRLSKSKNYKKNLARAFIRYFGGRQEINKMNQEFADYLKKLSPQWKEIYRSLETQGDEWVQIAFPKTNAIAWRTKPVGKDSYTISGKLKILPNLREADECSAWWKP